MSLRYFEFSFIFILIISLFFGNLFTLRALAISPSSISVKMVPENPSPYQDVTINLSSYAADLNSVLISWVVNNKTLLSGIGKKSFSLNAPAADSETIVLIQISFPDGDIELPVSIVSGNVVLLWQAPNSYVPPFYKGKALPTSESDVKIVAIPEIRNSKGPIDIKNMTYVWKLNYNNDQEASGYGKNSFTYKNDYLENTNTVSVVATTLDQRHQVKSSIDVGTIDPKIVFYRKDKQLGTLWGKAVDNNYKIEIEEVIEAIPYFLSPNSLLNPGLIWTWSINNSQVFPTGFAKNLILLNTGSKTSGISKLRLDLENQYSLILNISKEVNLKF